MGRLVLAGTPIGDVTDASPRLLSVLAAADVVAAEDTRRLHALLQRMGAPAPAGRVVSYFEGNEAGRTPQLLAELQGGATVVLVTDAGMPSVSDPGFRLVAAAVAAGVPVTAVPGPSAVLAALAVSGLPTDRFCFEGFLPRKAGERARRLAELVAEPRTMVFFEAPHRTAEALVALAAAFGADRAGAVCRELTKTYEEVRRGGLAELASWAEAGVRGEVTLVVAGAAPVVVDLAAAVAQVVGRVAAGEKLKPAVAAVATETGLAKNALYDAALAARRTPRTPYPRTPYPRTPYPRTPYPPNPAILRTMTPWVRLEGVIVRKMAGSKVGRVERRAEVTEQGQRRNLERPPQPDPLPVAVVDNHCHLDVADGRTDLSPEEAIAEAAAVGVTRIVQVGCDVDSSRWAVAAAERFPSVVAAVALHPNDAARLGPGLPAALTEIEALAAHPRVRAIGETGLDRFRTRDDEGLARQREAFAAHVALATAYGKALVIHDRDAHAEILDVLDAEGVPEQVVMHCFSGDVDFARACLDRGAHLSFAGTVTFGNAQPLRDALALVPRDRILVETDAPYLTPMPFRGRPNASYLVPHTVRRMAEVRGDDLAELCAAIAANTDAAFGGPWAEADPGATGTHGAG